MNDEKFLEKEAFDYFITKLMEYPNNQFFNHMIDDIRHTIKFKDLQQNTNDEIVYIYGGSASKVL